MKIGQCAHSHEHKERRAMSFGKRIPQIIEGRKAMREICNVGATIVLLGGGRIGCGVANSSSIGALLVVPSILGIPTQFDLQTANGLKRRVEVTRRGRSFLGVRFI
jgi:hypothetical protein